jgi:hypothetical protein
VLGQPKAIHVIRFWFLVDKLSVMPRSPPLQVRSAQRPASFVFSRMLVRYNWSFEPQISESVLMCHVTRHHDW